MHMEHGIYVLAMLLCNNDLIKKSRVNNHINILMIYTAYIFIPERTNLICSMPVILIFVSITDDL